jgi:ABC-type multidrug transport system fused ATPase/permease subunit
VKPARAYARILRLGRHHLPATAAAAGCGLFIAAADLGLLAIVKQLVDAAAGGFAGWPRWGLLAVALAVFRESLAAAAEWLNGRAAVGFACELQERLFRHAQEQDFAFGSRTQPGDLVSRLFHDGAAAAALVTDAAAELAEGLFRLAALWAALWAIDPRLSVTAAAVVLPGVALNALLGRRYRREFASLSSELGGLYETAYDSFAGFEVVKSSDAAPAESAAFGRARAAHARRELRLLRSRALLSPAGQLLKLVGLLALAAYGAGQIGGGSLTPGSLAAGLVAAWALFDAFQRMGVLYTSTQAGLASAERVLALLDERPTIVSPPRAPRAQFEVAIRFEDVAFAYGCGEPILRSIRLRLEPGERVALVGATGSGKTTLLRLMVRLLDPTAGRITLDGRDLRELDLPSLRALFAFVPQHAHVFDRSLRDNILLGRDDVSESALARVAALAGLDAVAARLPGGLDTRIGSGGACLSGGERQRLAIARAALRDARVVLFDEATTSLDSQAETELLQGLEALCRGRTVITIAHRLSTIGSAERVIVLAGGEVAEDGDPGRLWARGGAFAALFDAQARAGRAAASPPLPPFDSPRPGP